MSRDILVFYGSYRQGRQGIKLARWICEQVAGGGDRAELIDAQAVDLPMLDQRLSDYGDGSAPAAMTTLAKRIAQADGFIFVTGEYNGGVQPGLKNLVDHFLPEFARRPAAIASYSAGPFAGLRAAQDWRVTLGALGMVVVPAGLTLARINGAFDADGAPTGEDGSRLGRAFSALSQDLYFWADAAKAQRSTN